MLSGRRRAVEWSLALAAVKAGHVAAGKRRPDDTVAVNIRATWRESLDTCLRVVERRLIHLRQRGLRRVCSRNQADQGTRKSQHRAPHRTVRSRRHRIKRATEAFVFGGIDGLVGFYVRVPFAV